MFPVSVLHQTTTLLRKPFHRLRCFLYPFYIKPQQTNYLNVPENVVSCIRSTSNHNGVLPVGIWEVLFPVSVLHQTTTYACISPDYQRYIPEISLQKQRKWLEKYVKDLKKFQLPWTGLQFFLNLALEVQDIPVLFVGNTHN